ncbi:hypothetical protein B0H13DRAFT_2460435 [Mycena leptocephala]|nr:hypothetical protein B0H13DRAFT_2460435 [Mycena leptocephala]
MSTPLPIPTALVDPIIEGYVQAIRPAFAFILIPTVFSAMLVPLLIMLFALSTPQTRRGPIFILNVLAICLGITLGGLSAHLAMESILFPFTGITISEDLVFTILDVWLSWITEAVLLVRIAATFPRARLPSLLAFPIAVKIARVVFNIFFTIQWAKGILQGGAINQFLVIKTIRPLWFQAGFILELVDNGYISALFLWRLADQGHLFNGTEIGRYTSSNQAKEFVLDRQHKFRLPFDIWTVSNYHHLLGKILLSASLEMVNVYVEIISTVFATVWSSTASFAAATSSNETAASFSATNGLRRTTFRTDQITMTTSDPPSRADIEIAGDPKPENWGDYGSNAF